MTDETPINPFEATLKRPNFLLIGAAKAGTTALYHHLRQHPQVFMPAVKEPHFFAYADHDERYHDPTRTRPLQAVTDIHAYLALFDGVGDEKAIGEASPLYLARPGTAATIHRYLPDARLIAILRDPAERAFSAYLHLRRNQRETVTDFRRALALEPERIAANYPPSWHFKNSGRYFEQLAPYFEKFPRERIAVVLHDDLERDPAALMRDLYAFLEVDADFTPTLGRRHNVSRLPRSRRLRRLLRSKPPGWLERLAPEPAIGRARRGLERLNSYRPRLDPAVRAELIEDLRDDIEKLEKLIDRDLSAWYR